MSTTEDQTTAIGLLNFAESYWKSAAALRKAKLRVTHDTSPVMFLYAHAIELYLKAYLRAHGYSVAKLKSKAFGHQFDKLTEAAVMHGLTPTKADTKNIRFFATVKPELFRYIVTGMYPVWPNPTNFDGTCKRLHLAAAATLRAQGTKVRQLQSVA